MNFEDILDILNITPVTIGTNYMQIQELVCFIWAIPEEARKYQVIICKNDIYDWCKKIGDYFGCKTYLTDLIPDDVICGLYDERWVNFDEVYK